ncbi:MAG: OadG family protein [Oscillospiraceae bacterium]
MNIAYSILSAAATVESAAGAAEASGGIVDRIQALGTASEQLKDPDYWGSVGIITLTGILIVFCILAILIFFFWLMGTIFKGIDKSKKAKAEAAKAAQAAKTAAAAPAAPAPAPVEEVAAGDNDDEIVAVISAAIAAYAAEEGTSYTIRNIRRRDSKTRSAWSLAGIGENTRPF